MHTSLKKTRYMEDLLSKKAKMRFIPLSTKKWEIDFKLSFIYHINCD